ncbi:hypothetical protein AUJ87_02915 [Candidatus Gracilibacteria bacterium CG1_02_38_174]|nr:MAG: hypothetical protein AUJ87_02915 [Candidatus Gracilibacteria bacterium CG1_02_38_174]
MIIENYHGNSVPFHPDKIPKSFTGLEYSIFIHILEHDFITNFDVRKIPLYYRWNIEGFIGAVLIGKSVVSDRLGDMKGFFIHRKIMII